ncbi:GDSL-type esterase/lipase family protein [Desulfonatronum sp. SC1]|uniref:SGNH/GDSL hydrolase family protein n=1 Tax=Desulfonatronum sp. SC1 TaxID=2109626 RepID=UPI000D314A41|nr:GDSL-type esterase/lipase family protein [Desulfonatronum sp. SC1]PTN36519.1 lysophospholipase [Desulfonatronum sp. SC1]
MPKTMVSVLLALLVLSLFISVLLARQCWNSYHSLHIARLDTLGQLTFPEEEKPQSEIGPAVLFFGDSRAAAWPSPDLSQEGFRIINRGIGGQTTAQVRSRFERHVLGLDVDVLILQVGVNDLRAIAAFPHQREVILQETVTNIGWMVERATENDIHVVLSTIFPLGKLWLPRKLLLSDTVSTAIQEVNGHLKAMGGASVTLLDTETILAGNDGEVLRAYREDYLHINSRGYAALNHELAGIIQDLVFRADPMTMDAMDIGNQ